MDDADFLQVHNLSFTYNHGHNFLKHTKDIVKLFFKSKPYKEAEHIYKNQLLLKFKKEDKLILKNINLKIAKNSFTSILGPNGSGKSTFIRCLLNLEPHYFGDIL